MWVNKQKNKLMYLKSTIAFSSHLLNLTILEHLDLILATFPNLILLQYSLNSLNLVHAINSRFKYLSLKSKQFQNCKS